MIKLLLLATIVLGSVIARPPLNCAAHTPKTAGDLLCSTSWRERGEVLRMSDEDRRNTMISELARRTRDTVSFYQGKSTETLLGYANLYFKLDSNDWRTEEAMRSMSAEDLRNTCIVELNKNGYGSIPALQGLNNMQLAEKADQYLGSRSG